MLELLPIVGIALLFWLFIIRPASRRQKEVRAMQSALGVGDEVVLTSGVYGIVRELDDQVVRVEIAEGVTIKVARGAIGTINREPADAERPETDPSDTAADGPEEN